MNHRWEDQRDVYQKIHEKNLSFELIFWISSLKFSSFIKSSEIIGGWDSLIKERENTV